MAAAAVASPLAAQPPRAPAPPAPSRAPVSGSLPASSAASSASPYLVWGRRKDEVLREFTVSGAISVAAAFVVDENELPGASGPGGGAGPGGEEQQALSVEKARQRLAALEAQARAGGSVEMTQAQYEQRIAKLQKDLTREWNASHRESSKGLQQPPRR